MRYLRSGGGQSTVNIVDQFANVLSHHFISDENDNRDRGENQRVFRHRLALRQARESLAIPQKKVVRTAMLRFLLMFALPAH
jgi:hypothetical protein